MRYVNAIHIRYNKLDLLFNRKIKAVVECSKCEEEFITYITRKDYQYVSCPFCDCVQYTGIEIKIGGD